MKAILTLQTLEEVQRVMDERRAAKPLRQRIIGTIVTGLQMVSEGRMSDLNANTQLNLGAGHEALLRRGVTRFQNDPLFHAVADYMLHEIMHDIAAGG